MTERAAPSLGKKTPASRIPSRVRFLVSLLVGTLLAAPAPAACIGDCGGDDAVSVNELIIGVGIALGGSALDACPEFDGDGDGAVAIAELVAGVTNALDGCAAAATPTATATVTASPTVTATPAIGPTVAFFGVTNSDDSVQAPSGSDPHGVPVFERPFGFGFSLVVEARHGSANRPVGNRAYDESGTPDLQVQATRPLGDGSAAVCDVGPIDFGGVPAVDPPQLETSAAIVDALNDFGCRFIDGTGQPVGRACPLGCVRFETGEFGCQSGDQADMQFCAPVSMPLTFPAGDTLVTVRVRDEAGNLGAPAQLIIRVAP